MCRLESGMVVKPLHLPHPVGVTLRKVGDEEYRCQFCYVPVEGGK